MLATIKLVVEHVRSDRFRETAFDLGRTEMGSKTAPLLQPLALHIRPSGIDQKMLAGNHGAVVGGEEQRHAGAIFRCQEAR